MNKFIGMIFLVIFAIAIPVTAHGYDLQIQKEELEEKQEYFNYLDTVQIFIDADMMPPIFIPKGLCDNVSFTEPCTKFDWKKYNLWQEEWALQSNQEVIRK